MARAMAGGSAPAAPPITIFWAVQRFSHVVTGVTKLGETRDVAIGVDATLTRDCGDVVGELREIEQADVVTVIRTIESHGRAACTGTEYCYSQLILLC